MDTIKAKKTIFKNGFYEFTESELVEKKERYYRLNRKMKEIEARKKSAMDHIKAEISDINAEIEEVDSDINTGRRHDDFECICYLDQRNGEWMKVFESIEHGHEVDVLPFDFDKEKHLFPLDIERDVTNAVKKVKFQGEVIMSIPMTREELQMKIDDMVTPDEEDEVLTQEEEEVVPEEEDDDELFPEEENDDFTFPDDLEKEEDDER